MTRRDEVVVLYNFTRLELIKVARYFESCTAINDKALDHIGSIERLTLDLRNYREEFKIIINTKV
jgi:hypothetical protein